MDHAPEIPQRFDPPVAPTSAIAWAAAYAGAASVTGSAGSSRAAGTPRWHRPPSAAATFGRPAAPGAPRRRSTTGRPLVASRSGA